MAEPVVNMQRLRRSRTLPEAGDVFALKMPGERFLFGRVILAKPERAPMPESYLVYIYSWISDSKEPPLERLGRDALLLPPSYINRLPWTKGFFETVSRQKLTSNLVLDEHCFWSVGFSKFFNERGESLPRRVEPCGIWALGSYRHLDDEISEAIGIPLAPMGP